MDTTVDHVEAVLASGECLRDTQHVQSGTRMEIGCHHAEMNVICNAAANGVPTRGAGSLSPANHVRSVKTYSPCRHRKGPRHRRRVRGANGVNYLEKNHGVEVERVNGPRDLEPPPKQIR